MVAPDEPECNVQPAPRRSHRRARLCLPATVETVSGRTAAEITSLSRSGACVRLPSAPRVGNDIVVMCGDLDAFGTVVWSGRDACGIRFDELLSDEAVLSARYQSDHQPELIQAQRIAAARAWAQGYRP